MAKVAYCESCFKKLARPETKMDQEMLAAENASWTSGQGNLEVEEGTCSKCGKNGPVIYYAN